METTTNGKVKNVDSARKKRINQIILLSALVIILNAFLNHSLSSRPDLVKVGDTLPGFSVTSSTGEELGLPSIKGRPALLYFFAEWCPCSHESIGFIKRAEDEFAGNGLAIIGIGIQDRSKNLAAFVEKHNLKFPVSITGGDDVARSLGVKTTPTALFVDKDGKVRAIHIGKIERYGDIAGGLGLINQNNNADSSQG
jgi:peroxiredoxin